ncbi:MAG: thrombospondin type 3 repeat-containing protein [Phycisphaerae bacterium]|nr:thrombospondin type 3 repeat-containing protein [Saprospiraceae bacterium]
MRKLPLLLLLAFCLQVVPVTSQNQAFKSAIHVKLNFIDYGLLFDNKLKVGQGFEFAYFRNIAPALNIGVPFKLGLAKLPGTQDANTLTAGLDLQFRLENMKSEAKVIPFAFGGAGYVIEKDNSHVQFPFGAGLHFRVSPYAFINLQGEFRKALMDDRDNLQIGIGYVYLLHQSENRPAPPQPLTSDQDKDGTPDSLDVCPTLAGPPTSLGCPDADSDGIGDKDDVCPDEAGMIETNGCPDYDKDGFADKLDDCPTVAGPWNGCPDSDLDGIADKDDKCPNEKGTASNMGCPESKDSDGDGTPDDQDLCPDKAGPNKGCPDTDGDGIADNFDSCPEVAGTVSNNGCPEAKDTDGDGFVDENDQCPTEAGPINGCPQPKEPDADEDGVADNNDPCPDKAGTFNGCPDSDDDGIADNLDKCPDILGTAKNNGCPEVKDKDGDGVPDSQDKCPTEAGTANNKGCPEVKDKDRDGVADDQDPCPETPGKFGGCPDSDEDGVADNLDNCPDVSGTAKNNGCPEVKDADGDGIPDSQDKCPTVAGIAKNNGCPEVKDKDRDGVPDDQDPCPDNAGKLGGCPDTDGDNVADNVDKCPNTVGIASNDGCPEEKREITAVREKLATAARAVQFESAKAILKDQSYDVLDEVVTIMRQNASYSLSISGYTDDVGDDAGNLRLSQDRAKACYDYLIFRGIKADRIRFTGFGEARPIASNDTEKGREQNRRVEFELILE